MTAYKKYVTIKDRRDRPYRSAIPKQGQVVEVVVIAQDNAESEERVRGLHDIVQRDSGAVTSESDKRG
jgi:hypothetical protein